MRHFPSLGIGRAPEFLAGFAFDGDQQSIRASRRKNDVAAINQWALPGVPLRDRCTVLTNQVYPPFQLARFGIEANDMAFRSHRDDKLIRYCRDGAGHSVVALDRDWIGKSPDLAAIFK